MGIFLHLNSKLSQHPNNHETKSIKGTGSTSWRQFTYLPTQLRHDKYCFE